MSLSRVVVPLVGYQRGLWPGGAPHAITATMGDGIGIGWLRAALDTVVARHDALRARVRETAAVAYLEILPSDPIEVGIDGDDLDPDPSGAPLRVTVLTSAGGPRLLRLSALAAALDPHSLELILDDLRSVLAGGAPATPGHSWADHAAEVTVRELFGAVGPLEAPPTARVPAVATGGEPMSAIPVSLPAPTVTRVDARWDLRCFLATTLAVLVARLTGTDDGAVGVALRDRSDLVGPCETIARVRVTGGSFTECCARAAESLSGADPAVHGTSHILLRLRPESRTATPDLLGTGVPTVTGAAPFDLVVDVRPAIDGSVSGSLAYDPDRFTDSYARMIAERWTVLIEAALAAPDRDVRELPLLGPAEASRLAGFAGRDGRPDEHRRLHEIVFATAARAPDATAVTDRHGSLTYAELARRARGTAAMLRRRGAGPDSVVAVCADRSVHLVTGMLGILAADAAYLPLDPEAPPVRTAGMLAEAGARMVLADPRYHDLSAFSDIQVLPLDAGNAVSAVDDDHRAAPTQDDLAYVMFTSGSTGRPKAVAVPHRGIVNRLLWMQRQYGLTPDDAVLQKTPATFDVSVWEFFWPLVAGARLVLAAPGEHRDAAALAAAIQRERVTTVHFVPSMLALFVDEPSAARCTTLRTVICSGEVLPVALANQLRRLIPARLHNLYGPTEASIDVTHWTCRPVEPGPSVPIGRPIDNTVTVVLDRHGRPVPVGTPGELHLGGVGLARGYLGRPGLTAERFVADPLGVTLDGRLYRTGDLARWVPDGTLEYLGRTDQQIKLHGIRVEPGEIEAVLRDDPSVLDCVVLLRQDIGDTPVLVAYVASPSDPETLRPALRERLASVLPAAMVPAYIVVLPRLPATPNGKLDRDALRTAPYRD